VFTFLQPAYSYSRQEGIAKIPIRRNISEDGRTQVTYRTRDLTARDKHVRGQAHTNYTPQKTKVLGLNPRMSTFNRSPWIEVSAKRLNSQIE
jgi:hypothetical protein